MGARRARGVSMGVKLTSPSVLVDQEARWQEGGGEGEEGRGRQAGWVVVPRVAGEERRSTAMGPRVNMLSTAWTEGRKQCCLDHLDLPGGGNSSKDHPVLRLQGLPPVPVPVLGEAGGGGEEVGGGDQSGRAAALGGDM